MKTLLNKATYYENSAYINSQDVQEYADRSGQDFDDAFNDLEQELSEYDFIEEDRQFCWIF